MATSNLSDFDVPSQSNKAQAGSIRTNSFTEEEIARLKAAYKIKDGEECLKFVRTDPGNVTLPAGYDKFKDGFKNWKVRPDDIYILSFPKSGTTWTQELVWLVENCYNFQGAKSVSLEERFPFMEWMVLVDCLEEARARTIQGAFFESMEAMASPRFLKSHLHLRLLPDELLDKCRVVSCLRNPKDIVVSYYHHERLRTYRVYDGDFQSYFDLFMNNLLIYSSYFDYVTEIWNRRNHPNLCLLFYEDMKKDLKESINKVATFFGKDLTDEQERALVHHLGFENMKNNEAVNKTDSKAFKGTKHGRFLRRGEIGDWKNYFTEEMNKQMDDAIEKHFKPIGLEFQYE